MTDEQILDLYWSRDEQAISCTDHIYGSKLLSIAARILCSREDSEECVSDTYLKTWETIPPKRPAYFFAYLAKICRHLAFGKLDWDHAAKRNAELISLTEELQLCIPDKSWERRIEGEEIGHLLNEFLAALPKKSRSIFLRRYWYCDSVAEISNRYGISQSKVKTNLHRTRGKLRAFLEKEGISV